MPAQLDSRSFVRSLLPLALAVALVACKKTTTEGGTDGGGDVVDDTTPDAGSTPDAGPAQPPAQFSATLSGGEVVPPVLRVPGGTVQFTLNGARTELSYHVELGATGGVKLDVHRGAPGDNGPSLFEMQPINQTFDGKSDVTPDIAHDLEAGLLYVDLHTYTAPDGECRGQILQPGATLFTAPLDGTQLEPPVATTETGFASFVLSADKSHALLTLATSAAPTDLQLVGLDGKQVLEIPAPAKTMTTELALTSAQAAQLAGGQLALVLATDAHAAGELRGQIVAPGETLLAAKLSGAEVVPPVATQADGRALVLVSATRRALRLALTTSATKSAAHVHLGLAGGAGDVLVDFDHPEALDLNDTQAAMLLAGHGYVDVHTAAHADGEVRGQLVFPGESLFAARLSGTQALPPNTSPHSGSAQLLLAADRAHLRFAVQAMAPATGIRLEVALPGTPGPVKASGHGTGGLFEGQIALTAADAAALDDGRWAATVTTAAYGNGELRGQIAHPGETLYVAALTGDATVPMSGSLASGNAMFLLAPDGASLRYLMTSVVQPTAAHLHQAAGGLAGPVIATLANPGASMHGTTALSAEQHDALVRGLLYVDVHTSAYADGETRGQLLLPGEVLYSATLEGGAESPPVTSGAKGGIGAILSADKSTLRYDGALAGLTPLAVKLHDGPVGGTGPALYDLALVDGALHGALTPTQADLDALDYGTRYVNVTTDAHPTGEIRGNLVRRTP